NAPGQLQIHAQDGVESSSSDDGEVMILKGSLASLKMALGAVGINQHGLAATKNFKVSMSVDTGQQSAGQKIKVLFESAPGHYVPRYKIGNDGAAEDAGIIENGFESGVIIGNGGNDGGLSGHSNGG